MQLISPVLGRTTKNGSGGEQRSFAVVVGRFSMQYHRRDRYPEQRSKYCASDKNGGLRGRSEAGASLRQFLTFIPLRISPLESSG